MSSLIQNSNWPTVVGVFCKTMIDLEQNTDDMHNFKSNIFYMLAYQQREKHENKCCNICRHKITER